MRFSEVDITPDADENGLFERLAALGGTEILLELALDDADIDSQSLDFLGAATGSFRLISSFSANRPSGVARLPLSLLAQYSVSSEQLVQESQKTELINIIEHLAENARDWYSKGLSGLSIDRKAPVFTHLQLRLAMENRRLNVIRKDAGGFLEAGKKFGPADAWFAWRFLRRLQ